MNHSITYERDEQGVKSVTCSCGWSFAGWRIGTLQTGLTFKRASPAEFDTAIMDHERKAHKKWKAAN